ncbi:E3 ubiquitin-protein ligase TRIM33-like [Mya arenaria]|uniref:E3 ubiquitin-protein ligase TRIM33-like n=1 Tax=Mya arenaria TaxID=6604 RepID=UPI0022E8202C|nr:E3 ubiquitin-protein ligase TRIM33-like [Mya arenaria]
MEVPERKVDPEFTSCSAEVTPLCEPCRADGKKLEAHGFCNNCNEYMCPSCINVHGNLTATKHHTVLDKQKMPSQYPSSRKAPDVSGLELCKEHPPEAIKFFCPTHAHLSCGDCIVLNHRVCKVDYIREVAPKFIKSREFNIILEKSLKLEEDLKKSEEKLNANEQVVMDLCKVELKKIKDFRVKINEYLDKREQTLKKSIDNARIQDTDRLQSLRGYINTAKSTLAKTTAMLQSQNMNASQLYVEARQSQKMLDDMRTLIMQIEMSNRATRYKFNHDKKTKDLLSWVDGIGTILDERMIEEQCKFSN